MNLEIGQKEETKLSKQHNYSQYSKKQYKPAEPKVEEAPVIEMVATNEPEVVDVVTTVVAPETPMEIKMESAVKPVVEAPKPATGVVANCSKLNIRVAPDIAADVVCVLDKNSQVEINMAQSNKEWFSVCTASGVEGYCMRKFVEVNL